MGISTCATTSSLLLLPRLAGLNLAQLYPASSGLLPCDCRVDITSEAEWSVGGMEGTELRVTFYNSPWREMRNKAFLYSNQAFLSYVHLCLQTSQIPQLEGPARQTYEVLPSRSPGMAPLTTVEVLCSPTRWKFGTQRTTNGQTSLLAVAPLTMYKTCWLIGNTNSVCEPLTCTASASPAKSRNW